MWIFAAIFAYFLAAVNSVVDKYLLNRALPHPLVYAFWSGIFSIFSVILAPFGFEWPGFFQFAAAMFVGGIFLLALLSFFTALREDEASRIISLVGAATPIFILVLSAIIIGDVLTRTEFYAFAFLVAGGVIISTRRNQKCSIFRLNQHECAQSTGTALLAALFFALFFVSAKFVFDNQQFISGYVWTRIGSFLAAFALLLLPRARRLIFGATKRAGAKGGTLFVINKALGGVSFFILNYAIALGSIAIVNALEGTKYVFVLILAYLLAKRVPFAIEEETERSVLFQKAAAIILIGVGLFILSAYQ